MTGFYRKKSRHVSVLKHVIRPRIAKLGKKRHDSNHTGLQELGRSKGAIMFSIVNRTAESNLACKVTTLPICLLSLSLMSSFILVWCKIRLHTLQGSLAAKIAIEGWIAVAKQDKPKIEELATKLSYLQDYGDEYNQSFLQGALDCVQNKDLKARAYVEHLNDFKTALS